MVDLASPYDAQRIQQMAKIGRIDTLNVPYFGQN